LSAALAWRIEFHPRAERELSKLDRETARRVLGFLRDRVATVEDPRSLGDALKGPEVARFWKYRVGDYRLVCEIQDQRVTILVVRLGHRRDVYR
jgi:mRNA interferase RelE/StbE